jgi:hypothetical protein
VARSQSNVSIAAHDHDERIFMPVLTAKADFKLCISAFLHSAGCVLDRAHRVKDMLLADARKWTVISLTALSQGRPGVFPNLEIYTRLKPPAEGQNQG